MGARAALRQSKLWSLRPTCEVCSISTLEQLRRNYISELALPSMAQHRISHVPHTLGSAVVLSSAHGSPCPLVGIGVDAAAFLGHLEFERRRAAIELRA